MRLGELSPALVLRRLQETGLRVRTGPFVFSLHSPLALVREGLALLYADYPLADDSSFVDFTVIRTSGSSLPSDDAGGGEQQCKKDECAFHSGTCIGGAVPLRLPRTGEADIPTQPTPRSC